MPHVIGSARLALVTLGLDVLDASLDGDLDGAGRLLGAALPPEWPEMREVFEMRRDQLARASAEEPWLTRAIVLRTTAEVVGVTGFHGPPRGDWLREYAPEGVELGYTIFPAHRRRGLAAEAVTALITWARDEHGVRDFVLSIAPANAPSIALATRLGFHHVGEWTHPTRGIEHVYMLAPDAGAVR